MMQLPGWQEEPSASSHQAREAIVAAVRDLSRLGLNQGMAGNISVRVGQDMFITPSATPYETMAAADIATTSLAVDGPTSDDAIVWRGSKRASSEWRFHRDIYLSKPEIGAVVHAHPIFCTAIAMMRRGIPPCHYMIAAFGGDDVRCAGYATFGTPELSALVVDALQDRTACLLAHHGMVACGRDLNETMWRATELEALARQYVTSLPFGQPCLLSPAEITAAQQRFKTYRS